MIIIIGGGVTGLSLAYRLASCGEKVTVVERGQIGHGASWAAAGYFEPGLADTPMAQIEWQSLRMWPDFTEEIQRQSGMDIDYRTDGQLRIAYRENEADVQADFAARQAGGWEVEMLNGQQMRALEPDLSPDIVCASLLSQVGWVDGRKMCQALAAAIIKLGGLVLESEPVEELIIENHQATGVQTASQKIVGDTLVVAAGYQSDLIAGLPNDVPKSFGQKGIILTLAACDNGPQLHHLIKRPDGVICPRSDGRILVGVTKETDNHANGAEAGSVMALLQGGLRAMPKLAAMALIETIVGFRPYVHDNPDSAIGQSEEVSNLYHSLGHGSDGFLRAPYYADKLAAQIIG